MSRPHRRPREFRVGAYVGGALLGPGRGSAHSTGFFAGGSNERYSLAPDLGLRAGVAVYTGPRIYVLATGGYARTSPRGAELMRNADRMELTGDVGLRLGPEVASLVLGARAGARLSVVHRVRDDAEPRFDVGGTAALLVGTHLTLTRHLVLRLAGGGVLGWSSGFLWKERLGRTLVEAGLLWLP